MDTRSSVWIVLALVLTACGGGGGGLAAAPPEPLEPPEFLGGYRTLQISTNSASFGSGSANGAGLFSGTETRNILGTVAGAAPVDADFTVDPDGTFVWSRAPSFDDDPGVMTADGSLGTAQASGLLLLLEAGGGYTTAGVQGTYHFVLFGVSVGGVSSCILGTAALDGVGGASATLATSNEEGAVSSDGRVLTGTYAVAGDGGVTLDFGALTLEGGVGLGGEFMALAGGTDPLQAAALMLMVKEQPGVAHAGLLSGRYGMVGHAFDPSPRSSLSRLGGTLLSDGSGDATLRINATLLAAAAGCGAPEPTPYTVSGAGQLDITVDGEQWRGAITSSGEVAILGGGVAPGNLTTAVVLIRKRDAPATDALRLDPCTSGSIGEERDPGGVLGSTIRIIRSLEAHRRVKVTRGALLGAPKAHGFLRFDLSGLPAGTAIASATLVTTQDGIEDAPFGSGSVVIDHVELGAGLSAGDFDAPLGPLGLAFATLSSTAPLGERSVDVTAAVQSDLSAGRAASDFRLRLLGTGLDGSSVIFDDHTGIGPSTGSRTRLRITLP